MFLATTHLNMSLHAIHPCPPFTPNTILKSMPNSSAELPRPRLSISLVLFFQKPHQHFPHHNAPVATGIDKQQQAHQEVSLASPINSPADAPSSRAEPSTKSKSAQDPIPSAYRPCPGNDSLDAQPAPAR
ncbi:hypothetical protein E4U59_006970 [Claviceps monticola]|nr:hypothetical protein E4U59_006970 [Claviceps monticola]